jgi:hypothetical protein
MNENTLKCYLVKLVKPLLIALPLNLLIGLIYCIIAKKMSIVSYSDVLLIIGGLYAAIGGISYVGADNIVTINTLLVSRDSKPKNNNDASSRNFNTTLFIIGIITILISYVIGTFR